MKKKGWTVWDLTKKQGEVHVMPEFDKETHVFDSSCLCKPRVEWHEHMLIIHNAFDKREDYEEKKKTNNRTTQRTFADYDCTA